MTDDRVIRLRIPPKMMEEIRQKAKAEDRTMNSIIVRMLRKYAAYQRKPPPTHEQLLKRMRAGLRKHERIWETLQRNRDKLQ